MPDILPAQHSTPDGRFAYEQAGNNTQRPLIFLHGIGGAARGWPEQLAFFGKRYRAIAWDMPGYGGSALLADTSIKTLSDALVDFLDQIDAKNPVLVGHSIGGMIVQQFLADHPARAAGAVLAQTSPAFGKSDGDWQKAFIAARLGPLDRGETLPSLAASIVAELTGDNPDPAGVALAQNCMASVPEKTYRATVHALLGFDQRAALPRITIPTLLLAGEKDTNAPAAMMAKTATYIPGAHYVELQGAGHLANLEQPAAFNAALDHFLTNASFGTPAP